VPPGNRKIGGILDPLGGNQANGDGDQQIDDNQGQQHGMFLDVAKNERVKVKE
jgi:hypothetical protein